MHGSFILLSVIGVTAAISALFGLYMLKDTIWKEDSKAAERAAEVSKAAC